MKQYFYMDPAPYLPKKEQLPPKQKEEELPLCDQGSFSIHTPDEEEE